MKQNKSLICGLFVSALLCAFAVAAHADDSIFASNAVTVTSQPDVSTSLTMAASSISGLADSPTIQQHPAEVLAAADAKVDQMVADGIINEQQKIQIKGWFKDLPFHRIVDVKISFLSGVPDLIGLCIQGNPSTWVSIDACAGSVVFVSSLSAHVTSRFLRWQNIKGKVNNDGSISYHGHEFRVGPSVGFRQETAIDLFGGKPTIANGIDAVVSAEYVYWISRYFGFNATLDAGGTFIYSESNNSDDVKRIQPNVKLSLGVSF